MKLYSKMISNPIRFYTAYNQWGRHFGRVWGANNPQISYVYKNLAQSTRSYTSKKDDEDDAKKCSENATEQMKGREIQEYPPSEDPLSWQRPPWRPDCPQIPSATNDIYGIKVPDVLVPPLPKPHSPPKPMMDCTSKSPCKPTPCPPPPPCPVPPKRPFSWRYIILFLVLMSVIGLVYKIFLWQEAWADKIAKEKKKAGKEKKREKRPQSEDDLPKCVQYLIIGTGTAGWAAYEAIKEIDKTAKVFFVSCDQVFPYDRTPLSKTAWYEGVFSKKTLRYNEDGSRKTMFYTPCTTFMDPVKFYKKKTGPAVSVALGWRVLRVDPDHHVIYVRAIGGERAMYYERLLIATGSKPKNLSIFRTAPKSIRKRVCRLRSADDFETAYEKVREANHITIIGGGPLGVELTYYLARMYEKMIPSPNDDEQPPEICLIHKNKGILAGIIPEYLGEWAAEVLKHDKVELICKAQVYDAFEAEDGSGRIQLTLSNGKTVYTDYIFLCIGAKPRTCLAKVSELEVDHVNGGYLVNQELEARKHVYVAGDGASLFTQWKRSRMRMEHAANAYLQGQIAGANMAGHWIPCNMEEEWRLKLGKDLEMEVVGEVGACQPTIGIFKPCEKLYPNHPVEAKEASGDNIRPCYKNTWDYKLRYKHGMLFYLREDRVVGMVFWNFPAIEDRVAVASEILRAEPTWQDINLIAELLGFPQDVTCIPKLEGAAGGSGDCVAIKDGVSKWMPYEEFEKFRMWSKPEIPEIVLAPS